VVLFGQKMSSLTYGGADIGVAKTNEKRTRT